MKQTVKEVMRRLHELTEGMDDNAYLELVEDLVLELEAEHNAMTFETLDTYDE